VDSEEKRIIDSSEILDQKLEKISDELEEEPKPWLTENFYETDGDENPGVEGLVRDEDGQTEEYVDDGGGFDSNPPIADEEAYDDSAMREEMMGHLQEEIDQMRSEAMADIQAELDTLRMQAREEGQKAGYDQGFAQGNAEAMAILEEERARLKEMEKEYDLNIQAVEPLFVDKLTSIYQHIFQVDLSEHRDIILHLIDTTIHSIETGKNFIIRVSKEDIGFVTMQKSKLLGGLNEVTAEIVEDATLQKNECLIETEGGIFDCSLDVELEALSKKLKLLSYHS
jgi:flagellar assembly protein FliH